MAGQRGQPASCRVLPVRMLEAVRTALRITPETLPDYDLQVLFDAIDHDKSGSVEMPPGCSKPEFL